MSKERKLSASNVLQGESEGRSADELMAEKQERINSLEVTVSAHIHEVKHS